MKIKMEYACHHFVLVFAKSGFLVSLSYKEGIIILDYPMLIYIFFGKTRINISLASDSKAFVRKNSVTFLNKYHIGLCISLNYKN